jgi:hypothetical protein
MAKKVVATLKTATGRDFTKVISVVRSAKTGAYTFKEEMMPTERAHELIKKR